ncbi:hypothetical protein [Streptomyces sp. NPDC093707]|uniref:hypothetical protein n=1 Tax=Streptomyces sp. NPDC093707 TaxID=3154984 RepID=UPI00344DFA67
MSRPGRSGRSGADAEERPGHLLTVRAVAAYAASEMCEEPSTLDELIRAVEETLPHYADATCDHTEHAELPCWAPDLAELGITLSSAGGRARYARDHQAYRTAPLENLLCPVALAALAAESLTALRARRAELAPGGR